uniref:Outer membrane protein TolC n=1 Tax=Candidatus Kentrum sp. FW TaxID=2126338 RepID=A0A450SFH5_9GAMM|nr:MAG: Outer membrane protein TolC [Candidatus Kentron sp. FW]
MKITASGALPPIIVLLASLSVHARDITLTEALLSTLQNQPEVRVAQATVREDKGVLRQAQGAFDWTPELNTVVRTDREPGVTGNNSLDFDKTRTVQTSIGATKRFRTGISVSPEISLIRTDENKFYDPVTQSGISFSMVIPLLKGAGKVSASADERAARKNLRATGEAQVHRINRLLFETVSAYWQVRGSWRLLQVAESGLARAKQAENIVGALTVGGQFAPGSHQRTLAELNLQEIAVDRRRQLTQSAGQTLIDAIGISEEHQALRTVTPLPDPTAPRFDPVLSDGDLVNLALARRRDLAAARHSLDAHEILVARFRHDTKPRLDLSLGLDYQGIRANTHAPLGSLQTLRRDLSGPDYTVGLTLELPLGKNVAKGRLQEQRAKAQMAELEIRRLESAIRTGVRDVAGRIGSIRQRYRMAEKTVELYESVYQDTREQVIRGEANINQLVDIGDKLTEALLRRTQAATDFAVALAELRFVTGTGTALAHDAEPDSGSVEFALNDFMNLPEPDF